LFLGDRTIEHNHRILNSKAVDIKAGYATRKQVIHRVEQWILVLQAIKYCSLFSQAYTTQNQ